MENELNAPSGLVAAAEPGVNRIEFSAGTVPDAVYQIWRRHGDTVDWYLHATTQAGALDDREVKPGQYYEYKVRTVRGESVSDFSPSAVVYGMA